MRKAEMGIEEITPIVAKAMAVAINSGALEADMILQFVVSLPKGLPEPTAVVAVSKAAKKAARNKKSKEQAKRRKAEKAKTSTGKISPSFLGFSMSPTNVSRHRYVG